jgi:hypothetical protein
MWRVRPFTRRVVNPVTRLFAGWMPGLSRGRDVRLVEPELIVNPPWELIPRPARIIERMSGVTEFARMRAA